VYGAGAKQDCGDKQNFLDNFIAKHEKPPSVQTREIYFEFQIARAAKWGVYTGEAWFEHREVGYNLDELKGSF
jgi:hypothetical protein